MKSFDRVYNKQSGGIYYLLIVACRRILEKLYEIKLLIYNIYLLI